MEIGMLWFDNSSRSLHDRVQRAADFYAEKYGRKPTLCMVNPQMLESGDGAHNGIRLQAARTVMPNHFWIGVDDRSHEPGATGNGSSKGSDAPAASSPRSGKRAKASSAAKTNTKKRKPPAKRKSKAGSGGAKAKAASKRKSAAKKSRSKGAATRKGS